MAENTLGRNIDFPIYRLDGTPFYNLSLRKPTVDSVVMSLGDKITGDVYYKDNSLDVTMTEYIEYNGVKYTLVNPPTIVREGMLSDNGDLKGATKYSFEFYHPMVVLSNIPFNDVAVSDDEKQYLSENKTFSWIGYLDDYVAKINKNLQNTEWLVEISSNIPLEVIRRMSEVLTFDKNFIADALKKGYETWEVPYVVTKIPSDDARYEQGKRFVVTYGLPNEEILDTNGQPFVFRFGQGVGLKNNSRTPKNNKIITRLYGYGSERNIPFGYPQIVWYGESEAKYTYGDRVGVFENVTIQGHTFEKVVSYPIYQGIYGGAYVNLIKHPFVRKTLMPSVYRETLFNKISLYNPNGSVNVNYNPDITLVDYYDADISYENPINPATPSCEIQEFAEVYPRLGENTISNAWPIKNNLSDDTAWNDNMNENGEYEQSYFKITLPILNFDLYACAAITEEMKINMRSGACIGCTFPIQVDWEDYKVNFYDADGNFDPEIGSGHRRDAAKYPDSREEAITVIVQKEYETFGTIMPNVFQKPKSGDQFVILGISLPSSYITDAEYELDNEMTAFLRANNTYYFEYPLKFDEHFLATNVNILAQMETNKIVRFLYGDNEEHALYIKQITIKYGQGALPQYDITLTDDIEIVLNQLGEVVNEVSKLDTMIENLRRDVKDSDLLNMLSSINSKKNSDVAKYLKQALAQDSEVIGGVMLTTIMALRDENNQVWCGLNGAYDGTINHGGIAAWFGGTMDEINSGAERPAKIVFRFDGSGYLAGGNISWNEEGDSLFRGNIISENPSMMNKFEINGDNGRFIMYGPDRVNNDDYYTPAQDANQIELFSISLVTDPSEGLYRLAEMKMQESIYMTNYSAKHGIDFWVLDTTSGFWGNTAGLNRQGLRLYEDTSIQIQSTSDNISLYIDANGVSYSKGQASYTKRWDEILS